MLKIKRILCTLLVACLMLGLLPATTFAVDTSTLHNCIVPEGYHLFTDLPTADAPVTTETLYWGNAFSGIFYGINSTFTAANGNSSATTTTDVAQMSSFTVHYGGNDATYGDYYYLVFTLTSGKSYAFSYGSGYYSQNEIKSSGTPDGGWAHRHKFFYNAEEHIFFHRPSNSMKTMKAPQISATSQKIFTNYEVSTVLGSGKYPVRMYEPCSSDGVKGTSETHQWSGSCSCGYKFDYKEKESTEAINIVDPADYHQFDTSKLPTTVGETVGGLYLGTAFEANGTFYGLNAASTQPTGSDRYYTTSAVTAEQCTISVRYAGNDATYGDYYNLIFTLANGTSYVIAYSGGYFSQNLLTDGLPSDGFAAKHNLYYDEDHQFFYNVYVTDTETVMKGLKVSAESHRVFTEAVENLKVANTGYSPARLFEACVSDNVFGANDTHHWSGTCSCGEKFDYEENYAVETRAPQANTPYLWGVAQLDAEGQPTCYFKGAMTGANLDTVKDDTQNATAMYVENADGGYRLCFTNANNEKQYICLGKDATNSYKTYVGIVADAATATVFTWNSTYNTFVATVVKDAAGNTVDMVLGAYTSGSTSYTKLSGLLLTHLAQDHYFASHLYVQHMSHTFDTWSYDDENHWKACFCGKNAAKEAHTLNERVVEEGKIYSKCVCGYAELEGTLPYVDSHSVSLQDSFSGNFFVEKAQFDNGSYKDPYMVFDVNGQQTQVTTYQTKGDHYVFTFNGLAPDQMNETVTANLYATVAEETVLVSSDTFSVAQYCYEALRSEGTGDAQKTLLVETLNLGAAAQQYRNNNVENLANAELTDAEKALGYTGDLRELTSYRAFGACSADQAVRWYGASLVMGDTIKLRVYFETEDVTDLSIKAEGEQFEEESLTNIGTKDGKYYVDFAQLNPSQISEEITFTAYKNDEVVSTIMHYSVESYVDALLNKMHVSQEEIELVEAVIRYGDAAKACAERSYDLQEDVLYLGRTYEMDGAQWFNWSASGFTVRFQGSGLQAKIASRTNDTPDKNYAYLKVYVDGVEQNDILLDKTMQTVVLAEGLDANETHIVEVRKRNSPRSSTAGLLSLEVLNGKKEEKPVAKQKLIEFVGDSLTVGYSAADVNKTETAWSTKTEDGTKTYSKQVADAFGAEYMVTAISGRGVVMNNGGASGYLLPDIYPELDIYNVPGKAYDFEQQPDVVVINLGTNDATNTNLDLTVFQNGVVNFIKTVREKNPNAQIIWAYGLRKDNKTAEVATAIAAAVAQVNGEGDSKVYYLPLELAASMHLNHPTAAAYAPSGEKLIEKIAAITGWQ